MDGSGPLLLVGYSNGGALALDLAWPRGFYSLSHVAVPFPPDDPIYGYEPAPDPGWGIPLGALELRGERGLLSFPAGQFGRLRSNPFFSYIERRILALVGGEPEAAAPGGG